VTKGGVTPPFPRPIKSPCPNLGLTNGKNGNPKRGGKKIGNPKSKPVNGQRMEAKKITFKMNKE